jgi:PmbA protein
MAGPVGPDEIRSVAEAAMELPGADGVEVLVMHEWGGLTRFAKSSIHQSTSREDTGVRVRVISQDRVGVAATNDLTSEGARQAAASALEMARVVRPDSLFPGLAPKADVPSIGGFDEATATTTPERRAAGVAGLVGRIGDGFHGAGAFETEAAEVGLANTEGQFCYHAYTRAAVTTVVSGGDGGAGTAEQTAGSVEEIDTEAVGARAFVKARDSQSPRELAPGRYDVVLEPTATDTLVSFLAYMAFSGRAILEGRSPFSGKQGEKVVSDAVDIYDDARSPETIGLPFDFEGTSKRRTPLIERGVFVGGVYDRKSAKMAGVEPTGHALPPPSTDGAFPLNLFLGTGNATVDEMIAATERGLLVTRFHYSNVVHPIETTITGMTRDGTWMIENGAIAYPVRNLRFTQSILEALSNTSMIGRDSAIVSEFFFAASRVPAVRISGFNFSGASDH